MKNKNHHFRVHYYVILSVALASLVGCEDLPPIDNSQKTGTPPGAVVGNDNDAVDGECESETRLECHNDDIYWFDTCDEPDSLHQECGAKKTCIVGDEDTPECVCIDAWTGENCDVCPENWDSEQDCNVCQQGFFGDKCETCIRFVDPGPIEGTRNGLSWSSAFSSIQAAIDNAVPTAPESEEARACQVWVKQGTYNIHDGQITDSISITHPIHLFGSFKGDENEVSERQTDLHPTILDGRSATQPSAKVKHIMTVRADLELDGFVFTGADASQMLPPTETGDDLFFLGGGVWIRDAVATIRSCTFDDNIARVGGAIGIELGSLIVDDCTFLSNNAFFFGGAINAVDRVDRVEVTNSHFESNAAVLGGAISASVLSEFTVDSCVFIDNHADVTSAVYVSVGGEDDEVETIIFSNNLLVANVINKESPADGSVIAVRGGSSPSDTFEVSNCTLVGNGFGSTGSVLSMESISTTMTNSIIWGNASPETCFSTTDPLDVSYSALDCEGISGEGIISEDPLFEDATNGVYSLAQDSPCIDAADGLAAPGTDLEGAPRVTNPASTNTGIETTDGQYADIGAFEFQPPE